jgi:hypothetical protein
MDHLRRWKKKISKSSFGDVKKLPNDPGVSQASSTPASIKRVARPHSSSQRADDLFATQFALGEEELASEELTYARFFADRAHISNHSGFSVPNAPNAPLDEPNLSRIAALPSFAAGAFETKKKFLFQPLDGTRNEFRLLTIVPPKEWIRNTASSLELCSEPIQCLLEHVSLDDVQSDGEGPARTGPPRQSSVPTPRALPLRYLEGR